MKTETTPLDTDILEPFIALGFDDYLDILNDVVHDVPVHLQSIREAIETGNDEDIKSHAHSLRGMLSYFGCVAMTTELEHLETQAAPSGDRAGQCHSELQAIWEKSLVALKAWEKSVPDFALAGGLGR